MITYDWADVSVIRAKKTPELAQIYGRTVADVVDRAAENEGRAQELLYTEAKSRKHPMHGEFDWDKDAAAEKWNLQRAGQLIRAIAVVSVTSNRKERAFVHCTIERDNGKKSRSYNSRDRVMSSDALREAARSALLKAVVGLLNAWRGLLMESDEGKQLVSAADRFVTKAEKRIAA